MGVLGGFKNMLKTWRNNLRKKKLKKKKKNKKSFIYNIIAILIYPFAIIFQKDKRNNKTVINIEKKINSVTKKEELKQIEKEYNELKNSIPFKTKERIDNKIKSKSLEIIKDDVSPKDNNTNNKINTNNENDTNKEISKTVIDKQILNEDKPIKIKFDEKFEKELIKEINKQKKQVIKLEKYNDSYYILNKINELKEEIELLKQKYKENNIVFIDNLSYENIDILDKQVINLKKELENKKRELLFIKTNEKTKQEKEIKIEKKPKKETNELEKEEKIKELELCNKIIIENINKCNLQYNAYLKEIKKRNSRNVIFKYINIMSGSVLNFLIGIIPFRFIKNKILLNYVNAINANNTIRAMYRITNPLENINFILLNKYKNIDDILKSTYLVMTDSLEKISKIKKDVINLDIYNIDRELYNKILNIESLINENIKRLEDKQNDLNKIIIKTKKYNI